MGDRVGRRWVWAIVVIALTFGACTKEQAEAPPSGGTLVVGITSEPGTLNPLVATAIQEHDIINMMFSKLLVEEADFLNFRPGLAERWSFSADSLSITFHLREGMVWQDGVPITAADVRFTWQLQTDTLIAWASRHLKDGIRDVDVVDDHTVVFHYGNRYPYQLKDANDGVILPRHVVENIPRETFHTSPFGRDPVGNGPFRLATWAPGQYIELERNNNYFRSGRPYIDRVVFRVVPDMTTLVTQLKTGEIDCLESIPTDALPAIESDYPNVKIHGYPSRSMSFITWNLTQDIFEDRDIRRALAMSMNAAEIIETLWNGRAEIAVGPMHPTLWAHDPQMAAVPYDPEGARAIFERKGWADSNGDGYLDKDGRTFEFNMTTNQGVQIRADIMTMAQEYLRRVGIKVNARVLEWSAFISGVMSGEFDSCVLGWKVSTRADLSTFWRSTATPPSGFNASRYNNPEVDALIDEAKNTLDEETARRLWYRCQRIIYDDQPIFFLSIPHEVVGLNSAYCGVEPNAHGFFVNVADWYVGKDCE